MTGAIECRYYGRDFTAGEMALLRALIAGPPPLNRHMLSKEFCRRIGWFKPDGGLKDMMARVAMLAMHRDGLIALPAPQGRQNRPGPIVFGPDTEAPLFPAPTTLDEVRPLDLRPVVRGTRQSKLWNEFVARYHYLGYKTLVGAQMRYAVHDRDGWPLAMLGFSTAAWKLAPRDNFIGWTRQLREKNLPFVVDNPRFLILPWINIPNLGSHILAIIRRRLPDVVDALHPHCIDSFIAAEARTIAQNPVTLFFKTETGFCCRTYEPSPLIISHDLLSNGFEHDYCTIDVRFISELLGPRSPDGIVKTVLDPEDGIVVTDVDCADGPGMQRYGDIALSVENCAGRLPGDGLDEAETLKKVAAAIDEHSAGARSRIAAYDRLPTPTQC